MKNDPHKNAIQQLESVAKILRDEYQDKKRFDTAIELLKKPQNLIEGEIEVKMDDGKTKKFKAFRSQHNNAVGPYKGGIRFHPNVSREEVMALSTWMSWKCSVTQIPFGGGKGGVQVDPRELSEAELQRLSRAYARFIANYVGPHTDVPAPDVNTNGQIMAWMVDETQKEKTKNQKFVQSNLWATYTGKPIELGGSAGREEATGLGGVFVLENLAEKLKWKRKQDITVAIQGFGNVGYYFAYHADRLGYKVVAASDSKSGVYVANGMDPVKTLDCKKKMKVISGCLCSEGKCNTALGKPITNEELLELDVDVLVPAALENVITAENADKIKAKYIIEMANGPITPEADKILDEKGIEVIPDILANAGGVSTSYFEWVQNLQSYYWSEEEVLSKLEVLMNKAFSEVWKIKTKRNLSFRMAAYSLSIKRIVDVMMVRGWI